MTVTLLASFDGADGEDPLASLMFDSAGNLIGTANMGGANGDGTIFELQKTASGYADTPTVLAQLTERITGGIPYSYVLADSSGNLIVPIYGGGPGGYGTVLELAKSGTGYASPTVLASFNGSNGGFLNGGVLIDANGDILGSSWEGGTNGAGSVYEIAKTASGYASAPTVIAQFNGTDGLYTGPLVMDAAGNLFGGTLKGGPTGNGTL